MKRFLMLAGVSFLAMAGVKAHADTTTVWFVPGTVDLRAGPDETFPVVDSIPAQAHMQLEGCLTGWTWCDVSWNEKRGWISGNNIESISQSKTTYVTETGATLKVPIIDYNTGTYWDTYYKTAPFYTKRQQFVQWVPVTAVPTAAQ